MNERKVINRVGRVIVDVTSQEHGIRSSRCSLRREVISAWSHFSSLSNLVAQVWEFHYSNGRSWALHAGWFSVQLIMFLMSGGRNNLRNDSLSDKDDEKRLPGYNLATSFMSHSATSQSIVTTIDNYYKGACHSEYLFINMASSWSYFEIGLAPAKQ